MAVEAAAAGRAAGARAREIASSTADHEQGGLLAALFPGGRRLALEFAVIAGLIVLVAFLVYHFTTHTIVNRRPLGGRNVAVAPQGFDQAQLSFAFAGSPRTLFGASNDTGREVVDVYRSSDGGATWKRTDGPPVPGSCAQGSPQVAAVPGGEVLAFLGAPECGSSFSLTPFLVVSARSGTSGRWGPLHRVAKPTWAYGFDDAPSLAASGRHVFLAWTRSLGKYLATTVVSSSANGGRTWSRPVVVSRTLSRPHLATTAVAPDGTLYVAGIDAKLGLWATLSHDGGRTFAPPVSVARLLANPAPGCALTGEPAQPLPREQRSCEGPDPTILVDRGRVLVVYDDVGANRTADVFVTGLDRSLRPLFHFPVNPPDMGKTQQIVPAATVDPTTGTVWACWYDTTYDPNAHRVWFTCSASHDGRTWSAPVAAASKPSAATDVYGTIVSEGLRPSIAASHGVAHVFWADSRNYVNGEDVWTAAIPQATAFAAR